jgi:predicted amidohydrolase
MLRVGLAQIDVAIGRREENYRKVAEWMERYYTPSPLTTAIVLPEIWDVGYALEEGERLADPHGAEAKRFLGSLAGKYGVWFVGGSVLAKNGVHNVNRAQVIDPSGTLVAEYDKAHLIPLMNEDRYLQPGGAPGIFEIDGVRAGCTICYDIRFCEWLRAYALEGAKVLFVSAEWPQIRIDHWKALLKARAIENMMYVVACNRVGTSKETLFGGASTVIDPWGETLYEGGSGEEGVFVEIDPEKVQSIRDHLQVFRMRRPELYGRLVEQE